MFPEGGFALHGSAKVFGLPGAALSYVYVCKAFQNGKRRQHC
jgi:PTS system arbutin-like IIC component